MVARHLFLLLSMVMLPASIIRVGAQDTIDVAMLMPDSSSSARWENDDRCYLAAFEATDVNYSIVNAEGDRQT
jgi:ABC-type xylose transport system substrate-binding protein